MIAQLDFFLTLVMALVAVSTSIKIERLPMPREVKWWFLPRFRSNLRFDRVALCVVVASLATTSVIVKSAANRSDTHRRESQLGAIISTSSDIKSAVRDAHQVLDSQGQRLRNATDTLEALQGKAETELLLLTATSTSLRDSVLMQRMEAMQSVSKYARNLRGVGNNKVRETAEGSIQLACEMFDKKLEHVAQNSVLEAGTGHYPERHRVLTRDVLVDSKAFVDNFISANSKGADESDSYRLIRETSKQLDRVILAVSKPNLSAVEIRDMVYFAREALLVFSFHAMNFWRGKDIQALETVIESSEFKEIERSIEEFWNNQPTVGH